MNLTKIIMEKSSCLVLLVLLCSLVCFELAKSYIGHTSMLQSKSTGHYFIVTEHIISIKVHLKKAFTDASNLLQLTRQLTR